jgi:ABC-type lipoprotein release transport system permease subunit
MILETLLIILTFLGITMALISVIVALGVVLNFARQAIKRLLQATPTITLPKRVPKEEKEKPIMSK